MGHTNHTDIRVLYVEDDETIGYLTKDSLMLKGFQVEHVIDGQAALELFNRKKFQICIIDIMLPGRDGFSLAREIRKKDRDIPLLFLSAKSLTEDKIKGLSLGADDYITKPFSIEELILRMEVFLKRKYVHKQNNQTVYRMGQTVFHFKDQYLECNKKRKNLTLRESELLKYFVKNGNRVLNREEILKTLWGNDDYFLGRSLDVFISRLRKLIKEDSSVTIRNIHGVGFIFQADVDNGDNAHGK